MCEEYESLHDRSGRPDIVMGQSIVLSEIKKEVLSDNDDPAYQNFLLQQYGEQKLSQQDRLSKFCMDAGLLNVVEIGQYFMTKDTGDLTQFHAVACREYTLPREKLHHNQEDGSRETQKLDPCWKLQPVACMVNVESRLEFGLSTKTILTLGLEFLMDPINL